MRFLVIGILIVLGVGMTLAQGLTRKEQAALSGVVRDLDRVERNLVNIMDSTDPATRQKRLSSEAPKIEKILKDTKAELDVLPATNADVATQIVRHGTLSTRFLEVTKQVTGGTQTAAAGQAGWDSYVASPQYKIDQDFIKSLGDLLRGMDTWFLKLNDLNLMGNPNSIPSREKMLSIAKDTSRLDKVLQELSAKYTAFGSRDSQRELNFVNAARADFAKIVTAQTEFKAKVPTVQMQFADAFNKALNTAVTARNWLVLTDLWGDVGKNRTAVSFLASVYKALEPSRAVPLEAVAAKVEESYKSTVTRLQNEVIANNKPPKDTYTGADINTLRSTIQSEWKKRYPKYEILAVRIVDTEWSRLTGAKWDDFESAWVRYDYSNIDVVVAVKWDSKHAAVFTAELTKQHMKNDAILMRDQFNPTPNPTQLVLLNKF